MGDGLAFRILGPLAVRAGDRELPVGGARQRTVLALLLLSAGRVVSVDTLVDVVWNGSPPATARTQIAIVIAALRKSFRTGGTGDEVIVTAHPGYLLRPGEHSIDWLTFQRLTKQAEERAEQGRDQEAVELYGQGLALWRGAPLSGVMGRAVEEEADRISEHRLNVHDAATTLRLRLGHHQELVPELSSLVRDQPLRESTRHHLMLAQYRSGRRAEAMATFRETRRLFVDELGMEPGPELQELHDAILRDDPALAAAPPPAPAQNPGAVPVTAAIVPSELAPDVPGFTGREAELALLDTLLVDREQHRTPTIGLITGSSGVGKTGLAVHWAHRYAENFPDGQLFADLRGYDEDHEPASVEDVLSRFIRSLGVPAEQVPLGLEERISMYRSALAGREVLLLLDNVRTYGQIRPLLPSGGRCTVLVTSREQLEQLVTWPQKARVHLGVLPEAEAVELLGRIVGPERVRTERADASRLVELCDRLPLALRIAAARLASKPHWRLSHLVARLSDERRRLDELSQGESRVRASFELSYRYLPERAARLYRRLGLLDVPDFTAWVGGALLDVDVLDAERVIEDLVDAQFLEVVGVDATGQLRYGFQNLLRLYARERAHAEESEEEQEAARDRAFRTWLTIAEEGHRREFGGNYSAVHGEVPRRGVGVYLDELLARPLEWFEAERLSLVAVVRQAAAHGRAALAWELTWCAVVLFETRNYTADWELCARTALAAAEESGLLSGQATMHHQLGAVAQERLRMDEAKAHYARALELYDSSGIAHGRPLTLRNLGTLARFRGELEEATDYFAKALPAFREAGDRSSEANLLDNMAQIELDDGRIEDALRHSREALRISQSIGDGSGRTAAQATYRMGRVHLARADWEAAREAFAAAERLVREKNDVMGLAHVLHGTGELHLHEGDLDGAARILRGALAGLAHVDAAMIKGRLSRVLGETCRRTGDLDEARARLRDARDLFHRAGAEALVRETDETLSALETAPAAPAPVGGADGGAGAPGAGGRGGTVDGEYDADAVAPR